jgi:hypothetical protein
MIGEQLKPLVRGTTIEAEKWVRGGQILERHFRFKASKKSLPY